MKIKNTFEELLCFFLDRVIRLFSAICAKGPCLVIINKLQWKYTTWLNEEAIELKLTLAMNHELEGWEAQMCYLMKVWKLN